MRHPGYAKPRGNRVVIRSLFPNLELLLINHSDHTFVFHSQTTDWPMLPHPTQSLAPEPPPTVPPPPPPHPTAPTSSAPPPSPPMPPNSSHPVQSPVQRFLERLSRGRGLVVVDRET